LHVLFLFFFFFFQAEDGIRDLTVTGVQTCALPISLPDPAETPRPPRQADAADTLALPGGAPRRAPRAVRARRAPPDGARRNRARSEEHTSELQSQSNLVCRLLLEKKKKKKKTKNHE